MVVPSFVPPHVGAVVLGPTTYTLVPALTELALMTVLPNEAEIVVVGPIPLVGDQLIVGVKDDAKEVASVNAMTNTTTAIFSERTFFIVAPPGPLRLL